MSPTDTLRGAIIYLLSPSAYLRRAMFAVLFGSYSILSTVALMLHIHSTFFVLLNTVFSAVLP